MGHKERRIREIEVLKENILKAARDLAIKEGWEKVSIRKIGGIIEYTPPVIYEHFKNKEAILIELEVQGFKDLKYTLEEARTKSTDPVTQLEEISKAFWEWAFYNAELYQVMFNLEGIRCSPTNPMALRDAASCVIETIRQIHLFSSEIEELFFNWWGIVHGHVTLVMSGQVAGMDNRIKNYMVGGVRRFCRGLA
ncbi:MAG: TetR/AcrR family transcriptional regulator [Bacteroidetes bacterium]|nr:TetR/AcrR family transcriptional regulator [Bacteroidota bacterium]